MKALVTLVIVLTAIVPSMVFGADRKVGTVKKPQVAPQVRTVVEINTETIVWNGNRGYWGNENLGSVLRERVANAGAFIAVSGSEFRAVAATQDRIHDSGRYGASSRKAVPRGQMIAPRLSAIVTASANIEFDNRGSDLHVKGKTIRLESDKAIATVQMTVEMIDVRTGICVKSVTVTGRADKSAGTVYASNGRSYGSGQKSVYNAEESLLREAAIRAVDSFINAIQ